MNRHVTRKPCTNQTFTTLRLEELEKMKMGSVFYSPKCVTYMRNGIREHKPPFDCLANDGYKKYIEFITPEGIVTDQFWGSWNDFNVWVLGKAGRGERFFIVAYPNKSDAYLITEANVWLGSPYEHHPWSTSSLVQNEDLTWRIVEGTW